MTLKFTSKLDPNKVAKTLGRKYKLVPLLDKRFETFDGPFEMVYESKVEDDAWHPSGHCMPPPSVLYALTLPDAKEYAEPISGGLRKVFLIGHFWHQLLQHLCLDIEVCQPEDIERRGVNWWYSGQFPEPYHWATGQGDIAPCRIPNHGEYVVDFKTMGSGQFKQANIPDWCADKYEAQINIYMDFFDLERGLIVAINKDSGEMKEFEYKRNQPLIDAIYRKWQFVSQCIDANQPPVGDLEDHEYALNGLFTGPVAV